MAEQKALNISLTKELHTQLKMYSITHNIPMYVLIQEFIKEGLNNAKKS